MAQNEEKTNNKSSSIKKWCSNIFDKCKKVEGKYWVNIALWILTLFMLIAMIVVAALQSDITSSLGVKGYSNVIAGVVLGFSFLLTIAIINIVSIKLIQKRRGGK